MMLDSNIRDFANDIGVLIGTILACFALASQLAPLILRLREVIAKRSLERRFDAILIRPSLAEIAKYSVQVPPKSSEIDYEWQHRKEIELQKSVRATELDAFHKGQRRLLILTLGFGMAFFVIAIRYASVVLSK